MTLPLVTRIVTFYCPNCGKEETIKVPAKPVSRMHVCPKLHMLSAPMLEAGIKAKVEARLRDDYVGKDIVQTAPEDGKPYMSVVTTRDNGNDVRVFAPTATARGDT